MSKPTLETVRIFLPSGPFGVHFPRLEVQNFSEQSLLRRLDWDVSNWGVRRMVLSEETTIIEDRYQLGTLIGAGGMGKVYRGWDTKLERAVAIKVLSRRRSEDSDGEVFRRLEHEVKTLAKLAHSSIVTVYDHVETPEGFGIVMELVEGRTLAEDPEGDPFVVSRALPLFIGVTEGLEFIHGRGVLHRDLKPSNIMVTSWGAIKILDFGLAKVLSSQSSDPNERRQVAGTLSYMSPEQLRGQKLDARSDLFSLGIIFYELLAGRHPFCGDQISDVRDLICWARHEPIPESCSVPPALERLVDRLLHKSPEYRPSAAGEVLRELRRVQLELESERRRLERLELTTTREMPHSRVESSSGDLLDHYQTVLLARQRSSPTPGLDPNSDRDPPVADVFVPLQARVCVESNPGEPGSTDDLRLEKVWVREAFGLASAQGRRGLVVLGDPGSGKTTLGQDFIVRMVDPRAQQIPGLSASRPVHIPLRAVSQPLGPIEEVVASSVELLGFERQQACVIAGALLQQEELLLIVDGLDEVAEGERDPVARWLEALLRKNPTFRLLVTSRYPGYAGDARLDHQFLELRLCALGEDDIRGFVAAWYRASYGSWGATVQPLGSGEGAAHDLIAKIFDEENPISFHLRELAANPLMLSCLCLIHHEGRGLPKRRSELYEECVLRLLDRWQYPGVEVALTKRDAKRILQPLAFNLHSAGRRVASFDEALGWLEEPLRSLGFDPSEGKALVTAFCDQSGLVVSKQKGTLEFRHQAFQDYLTALHIQDKGYHDKSLFELLAQHFGEIWWREVILLVMGLGNPSLYEDSMEAFLADEVLHRDQELASECLREAREVSPRPLLEALGRGLRSSAPEILDGAERFVALRLLDALPDWRSCRIESGQSGGEILEEIAQLDPLGEVRNLACELLGCENGEIRHRDGSVLIEVPAHTVRLGSDFHDGSRPAHRVHLSRYYVGKYPVTNAQYRRYLKANRQVRPPRYWNDRDFNRPSQPVVGVSWEEAMAYCRWAGLELPSEAQWEAVARGSDGRTYPWGDEVPGADHANFGGQRGKTTSVGQFPGGVGPYGTFDLAGNVREWCLDVWHARAYQQRDGATDPVNTSGDAAMRVLRGGSWNYQPWVLMAVHRSWSSFGSREADIGFRVALRVPDGDLGTES